VGLDPRQTLAASDGARPRTGGELRCLPWEADAARLVREGDRQSPQPAGEGRRLPRHPVLLPDAETELADRLQETFLDLNTWVDFRNHADPGRAFHLLACGIKGIAPGRWTPSAPDASLGKIVEKLQQLQQLQQASLVDDTVALDIQRKILDKLLEF
jgi:hypothetical protein